MKRVKPTDEEVRFATNLQAPSSVPDEDKPLPLIKTVDNLFVQLLNAPTMSADLLLGGGDEKTQWINTADEINPLFPGGGDFSVPFFCVLAWYFESKTAVQKSRIGMKLILSDGSAQHISLPYPILEASQTGYGDRFRMLTHFEKSSQPVGLFQFQKIDQGQPNAYWRLIKCDDHSMKLASSPVQEEIPF